MTERIPVGFERAVDRDGLTLKVRTVLAQQSEQLPIAPDLLRTELRAAIADLVDAIAARLAELQVEAADQWSEPLPDPLKGLRRTSAGAAVPSSVPANTNHSLNSANVTTELISRPSASSFASQRLRATGSSPSRST